jgi:hypothetical protein
MHELEGLELERWSSSVCLDNSLYTASSEELCGVLEPSLVSKNVITILERFLAFVPLGYSAVTDPEMNDRLDQLARYTTPPELCCDFASGAVHGWT